MSGDQPKDIVLKMMSLLVDPSTSEQAREYLTESYVQHNPNIDSGADAIIEWTKTDQARVALGVATAVVEAVDPQRLEVRRERVDLAEEVGRGEAALAERVRWRVGRRGHPGAARHELAEEPRHEHRVARVVELELVDADESRAREQLHGLAPRTSSTACAYPSAPTSAVYSMNVPKYFGPCATCHSAARRCVLPTPKPPSRYTPGSSMRAGRLREKKPPGRCAARQAPANSLSRSSAACCDG